MADDNQDLGPIGQMTRYAMSIAGLDRRRTKNRIGAIVGITAAVLLVGIIGLDVTGVFTIPGMGVFYDMTGVEDPDAQRVVERTEAKLSSGTLSDAERKAMRDKLLGAQRRVEVEKKKTAGKMSRVPVKTGVKDSKTLSDAQRATAADLFADDDKQETELVLAEPDQIQTPNLPDGLTREAIYKVVTDNSRSMALCIAEASRKGEMIQGRMDISITIEATGNVIEAGIDTPRFRGSVVGRCAAKRIRGWKFPRFNGDPVTVVYPYILGHSL